MIFVTVGSAPWGIEFKRLIGKLDEIALELREEIVAQIGVVENPPKHVKWFTHKNFIDIVEYFKNASIVVGHCGTGTILNALTYQKPVILVPRRNQHGELDKDDHQFELASRLRGMEGIFVVNEMNDLKGTIQKVQTLLQERKLQLGFSEERKRLLSFLKDYVRDYRLQLERQ